MDGSDVQEDEGWKSPSDAYADEGFEDEGAEDEVKLADSAEQKDKEEEGKGQVGVEERKFEDRRESDVANDKHVTEEYGEDEGFEDESKFVVDSVGREATGMQGEEIDDTLRHYEEQLRRDHQLQQEQQQQQQQQQQTDTKARRSRRSKSAPGRRHRGRSRSNRPRRKKHVPLPSPTKPRRRLQHSEFDVSVDNDHYDEQPRWQQQEPLRGQSAQIMAKRFVERNIVKKKLLDEREAARQKMLEKRKTQKEQWAYRMQHSPFKIDLVAENERLEEEKRMQIKELQREERRLQRRTEQVKSKVLVKALEQANDLEALRAEKRMILMEEKRLRALVGVEKSKSNKKNDLMAAIRAEKQRRAQKLEYRRHQRMLAEERYQQEHAAALLEKMGLESSGD